MDPVSAFGLISGGVQVLQAIGSTVHGLNQLYGRFRDADLTIQSLIQELNCIGTALASLREWIRLNSSTHPQSEEYNSDLAVALEGCRVVMDVVSRDVSDLVQSTHEDQLAVTGLRVRMRIVWNQETMKGHQEKLRAQVVALQLLLQVCQCRTSTEQIRLLRKATTRRAFDRVADDTATILSSRGSSYAGSISQGSRRSFSSSDRGIDFNNALAQSPVYQRARQPERAPTIGSLETPLTIASGNQSPFTDEGYASNHTGTSLTVPSLETPVQQEGFLALPSGPAGPVHSRSVSHTQVPTRPTLNTSAIRRNASDSRASAPALRTSGSRLERMASSFLGRRNTRSRTSLTASPGNSPNLSASPTFGRRRQRSEGEFNTSINITSDDTTNVPHIVKAAQMGSRDEVERLIERGSDIEARHQISGRNALLVAAHCGRDDVVDLLIHHNARLAVIDRSGDTALHLAASRGHCGALQLLLPECDLIETPNSKGRTPLRVAADGGQVEALEVLLAYQAQVNGRAENLMTALHAAAKRGDEEIVQILVSHGADLEAKDGLMMTALHYACSCGHLEVIKLLLDNRANIEAQGHDRKTPLICAAETGRVKAVELLMKRRASYRATDEVEMSAIHWAAYNGHHEALRLLAEKRGSLDLVNNVGRTALHLAAMNSQFAAVELLQRRGMSLDRRCKDGFNALHYACMADSLEIASLLILTGADIEAAEPNYQQRPLHMVALRGSVNLLDLLCDKGASINVRDRAGDRPLCVASRYGNVAVVQRLLDRGSPMSLKLDTEFGEDSPLCLAAKEGHSPVISLLLAQGASALKKDKTGWPALRYAAYHGHSDALQLLLSNSNILDTEIAETVNIQETIGFFPGIPEENKHRVQGVLAQALRDRHPTPLPTPSHSNRVPQPACCSPLGSLPGACVHSLPAHFPYEADSSTPQELPGSLDQERSVSLEHSPNSSGPTNTNQTQLPSSRRPAELNLAVAGDRIAALQREAHRASQPRETPQQNRSRDQRKSPRLSATYSPISVLSARPTPTPSPPPQPLQVPHHQRADYTAAPPNSSGPDRPAEAARVPRTLPSQGHPISRDVSCSTDQTEPESHDDSGSDTDSISSVYTAPEENDPGTTIPSGRQAEIRVVAG
ncbi:hypothetical protein N7492_003527 [Penicillium capsulatum]|uniref:protein S-acyltransferase n=1 Tax=Penicillium capsulatum TaxID=69766 RepID=A0A9W9IM26_9EURO|nr:hypothetical protein N7492_003527 [Penicillium capsulatum]KAJ6121889.1 hypothetical protein N7512_004354 [Penicillium capsulatum]